MCLLDGKIVYVVNTVTESFAEVGEAFNIFSGSISRRKWLHRVHIVPVSVLATQSLRNGQSFELMAGGKLFHLVHRNRMHTHSLTVKSISSVVNAQ